MVPQLALNVARGIAALNALGRYIHLLLILLGAGVACTTRERDADAPKVAAELFGAQIAVDTPTFRIIADSMLLVRPRSLAATADYVVVGDDGADSLLTVFDPTTGRFLGSLGDRNLPEGGWLRASALSPPTTPGDQFRVFDPISNAVLEIELGRADGVRRVLDVADTWSILQPMYLSPSHFVSTALRIRERFGVFSAHGQVLRAHGQLAQQHDSAHVPVEQHAHTATGALAPGRDRLVLAGRYSDHLAIYDTAGVLLAFGERPALFDPAYSVGTRGGAPALGLNDESRIGYVTVAAGDDDIVALYSGRAVGAYGRAAFVGARVYVFDWNGQFKRSMQLAHDAVAIALSADGRVLYALEPAPSPRLMAYALDASPARRAAAGTAQHDGPP